VEALTLPSAGEFFVAMAKAGRPNWSPVGRVAISMSASERPQIALSIGLLLTDGYLAVETQNSQDMKNISRDGLEMARRLNVGENVLSRGLSLTDFAENNEWNSLREEIEAAQNEVKISLSEQKDDPLAFLISLGSWLRSIQAGATLVSANYDPEPAALLRQAPLARIYQERLEEQPARILSNELIQLIARVLPEMEAAMQSANGVNGGSTLSKEAVEKVTQLSTLVVSRIAGALPPAEIPPGPTAESTGGSTAEPGLESAPSPQPGVSGPDAAPPAAASDPTPEESAP
jgi:hypothetical protein